MSNLDDLNKEVLAKKGWHKEQLGQTMVYYDGNGRMYGVERKYTSDISTAWELLEEIRYEMRFIKVDYTLFTYPDQSICQIRAQPKDIEQHDIFVQGYTLPEVICKLYLAWRKYKEIV